MKSYQIMTHIVAGYPSLEESKQIAETMIDTKVDHIEIQIPFSDPIGDGEVITLASRKAIADGTKVRDSMKLMKEISAKTKIPIYFMTYYNIPFNYGIEKFCKDAKNAGAKALIVPDIPYDEEKYDHFWSTAKKYNVPVIPVISPITPVKRLKKINKIANKFVYCVAGFGVTGRKQNVQVEIKKYMDNVRKYIRKPLALGFGVNSKHAMNELGKHADIVVIGSHIIRLYEENGKNNGIERIREFLD